MFIISTVTFIINVTIIFVAVVVLNTVAAIYAYIFNLGIIVRVCSTVYSADK